MSDDPRMDRLEAKVDRAGEPADAPHQEMAQAVADATVEAHDESQRATIIQIRGLLRDLKWYVIVVALVFGLIVVLAK